MYEASTEPEAYNSKAAVGVADVALTGGRWLRYGANRFGTLEAEIGSVRLLNPHGDPVAVLASGDPLVIELEYRTASPLKGIKAQVKICQKDGSTCLETTTESAAIVIPATRGRATIRLRIDRLDLAAGEYYVDVGLHERDWQHSFDNHIQAYPLRIIGAASGRGILAPPIRWDAMSILDRHEGLPAKHG